MKIFIFLSILVLTFLLTLITKLLEAAEKTNDKILLTLRKNGIYLWLIIIVTIGLIGGKIFSLRLPSIGIGFNLKIASIIILIMLPFWIFSGYNPGKAPKSIINFCLVFPIGEEILFRGVILSLLSSIIGGYLLYVPMPLLRGVSLQVFISAFLFAITHLQYFQYKVNYTSMKKMIFAFIFGLFAGNLVELTGSVLYTILFHVLANTGTTVYSILSSKRRAFLRQ